MIVYTLENIDETEVDSGFLLKSLDKYIQNNKHLKNDTIISLRKKTKSNKDKYSKLLEIFNTCHDELKKSDTKLKELEVEVDSLIKKIITDLTN